MTAKGRREDLKDFRAQILSLREKSGLVERALRREGIKSEDKSKVVAAVIECKAAAEQLKTKMEKFKQDDPSGQGFVAEIKAGLKSFGRKSAWPVLKPTLEAPVIHLNTCHKSLDGAISILSLNIEITNLEHVRRLDRMMMEGRMSLDQGFNDLESSINDAITRSFKQVKEQISQQTKLFLDQQSQLKAKELVQTLGYQEIAARAQQIDSQSPETDYDWIFTSEAWGIPDALSFIKFLNLEAGIFWISGDPASGKSSLMYYISKPYCSRRSLWQWKGNTEVTIACHYCWVAGSDMQKSQQALLQSLLYYVLLENLHVVPQVCQHRWRTWPRNEPWSIHELWACLEAVVKIAPKRLCLLIDGLDELQPERDHRQLVIRLIHLATYTNVKIVVSSRPWKVFENLNVQNRSLNMRSINKRAILGHLEKKTSSIGTFAGVSWDCLNLHDSCEGLHSHGDAHRTVEHLVSKADGNFLWVTIVVNRILENLRIYSNDLSSVRKYVDKIPTKVEALFQDMILQRLDDDSKSEMAMALWIALLPSARKSWISFWLLAMSGHADAVLFTHLSAEVALATAYHELKFKTVETMKVTTKNFIDHYCRDVLNFDLFHHDQVAEYRNPPFVLFRHRMIFDYCHTPEMQDAIIKVASPAFCTELFEPSLLLLGSKYYETEDEVCDSSSAEVWFEAMQIRFLRLHDLTTLLILQSMKHGTCKSSIRMMNEEAERVSHRYLVKCFQLQDKLNVAKLSDEEYIFTWKHVGYVLEVGQDLSTLGLYEVLDALLDRVITQTCMHELQDCFRTLLVHYQHVDAKFIRKLLAAGADPNEVYYYTRQRDQRTFHGLTLWCDFLRHLVANEDHGGLPKDHFGFDDVLETRKYNSPHSPETFSSVQVQTKIKDLLQFGAELELTPMKDTYNPKVMMINNGSNTMIWRRSTKTEQKTYERIDERLHPLTILRSRLPMDGGWEWPRLLESYIRREGQQQSRDRRQKIPGEWPGDLE